MIATGRETMPGQRCFAEVECQLVASVLERMKQLVDRVVSRLARFGQHVVHVGAHFLERLAVLTAEVFRLLPALFTVCGQRLTQFFGSRAILFGDMKVCVRLERSAVASCTCCRASFRIWIDVRRVLVSDVIRSANCAMFLVSC
jgi:hypothetical protein